MTAQGAGERNFHIFYQILSKAMPEELRQRLKLTKPQDYFFLNQNSCYTVDDMDDAKEFEHMQKAFDILSITEHERVAIFKALSAILHLGNLPFFDINSETAGLKDDVELGIAAELLGVPAGGLKAGLLSPRIKAGNEWVTRALNRPKAMASRDALCKALYGRLFMWIVHKINETLSHKDKTALWIGVLDISGFEIFPNNSFEQLCINYTNEKLQQFFNHHMFTLEQQEYEREKIDWTFENYGMDLQDCIDLIEKKPMGILPLLDEQTVFPDADDTSFTKKLFQTHENHRNFRRPRFDANNFKVVHYAGDVEYQTASWLEKNRDPLEDDLSNLCKKSSHGFVTGLFNEDLIPSFAKPATAPEDDKPATGSRSRSTGRGKGGAQFITVAFQYKEQLAHLMSMLSSTAPHFIRCIIPNLAKRPGVVTDQLVLDQLKCNGVLEGIRIARKGWPNRLKYDEFLKRYFLLKPGATPTSPATKDSVKDLIEFLISKEPQRVKRDEVRFGLTKIFFRSGQLAAIEELREQAISRMVVSIQAGARAFLARRMYDKMREQSVSARILQRNIRAWLELKNWPWYQLYVKARPLISQRNFQKEIDDLKKQVKDLEKEVAALKEANAKLDKEKQLAEEDADKLEKDLAALKLKLVDLEGEKNDLEEDNALLQKKVQGLDEELQEETSASNAILEQKRKLEADVAELKALLEDEERNRKALQDAKAKVEGERNDLEDKYEDEVAAYDALKKREEALAEELRTTKDALSDAENVADTLRAKVKSAERSAGDVRIELDEVSARKLELEKSKKHLEEELADTRAQLEDERSAKDAANSKAKQLQQQLDDARADADALKSKLSAAEKSLKTAKDQNRELDEELEDERAVRGNVDKQKKALEDKLSELESQASSLESQKNSLGAQVKSLKSQLDDAKNRLEDAEANSARLDRERKDALNEVTQLQADLDAERDAASQQKRKLNNRIQELQADLDLAASKPSGASSEEVKGLEAEIERLEEELLTAEDGRAAAEKNLEKANVELEELRLEADDAVRDKDKLLQENRKLKADLEEARIQLEEEQDAKASSDSTTRRLTNEVEDLKRRLAKETSDKQKAQDQRANFQRENEHLRSDRDTLERRSRDAERQLRDLRNQLEDALSRLDAERRAKEKATEASRDLKKVVLDRERQSLESLSKFHAAVESDKLILEDEIADLQEKNKHLQSKISQLQDELDELPVSRSASTRASSGGRSTSSGRRTSRAVDDADE